MHQAWNIFATCFRNKGLSFLLIKREPGGLPDGVAVGRGLSLVPGVHTEQATASSNAISRGSDTSGFYGHLPSSAYTLSHRHIIKSNANKYSSKDNLKIEEKGKKREKRKAHV